MIKLIASDLDGTLLRNGAQHPTPEAMELIGALREKGVIFAAASGRQCPNLRRLFWPASQEMVLLGENGCLVTYRGRILSQTPLGQELAQELIREIMAMDDRCEALVSCPDAYWLLPKTRHYLDVVLNRWKMTICTAETPEEICEPILKISMCMIDGLDYGVVEEMTRRWQGRCKIAVSGKEWLDFTIGDKGQAIRAVREEFGFAKEEVAAFGDNFNDVEMLDEAGHSYAMDTAPEAVKAHAGQICTCVEDSLREILSRL